MCGRFYVPEDDSIEMIRAVVEYLEHRNVKAKTGDVFSRGHCCRGCQQQTDAAAALCHGVGISPLR